MKSRSCTSWAANSSVQAHVRKDRDLVQPFPLSKSKHRLLQDHAAATCWSCGHIKGMPSHYTNMTRRTLKAHHLSVRRHASGRTAERCATRLLTAGPQSSILGPRPPQVRSSPGPHPSNDRCVPMQGGTRCGGTSHPQMPAPPSAAPCIDGKNMTSCKPIVTSYTPALIHRVSSISSRLGMHGTW